MKKIVEAWFDGIEYLITDDLISFYTFFTVIFTECAYLWASYEAAVAIPFSIILSCYVLNVIISAGLKGKHEGEKKEVLVSIIYVAIFIALFVTGCFINISIIATMTVIPLIVTALWIQVRYLQDSGGISNFFLWILSQIIVIGGPFIVFVIALASINELHLILKVIIPTVYLICVPFIAFFEDETATCNIFSLAYDITWRKNSENNTNNDSTNLK